MRNFCKELIAMLVIWFVCACASFSFCRAFDLPWNFKTTIGVFTAYTFIQILRNND